jgi:hypothetical protein
MAQLAEASPCQRPGVFRICGLRWPASGCKRCPACPRPGSRRSSHEPRRDHLTHRRPRSPDATDSRRRAARLSDDGFLQERLIARDAFV